MLNIATEPKTELFTKTASSSLSDFFARKIPVHESRACVTDRSYSFACPVGSELPVVPRPAYEWVMASSSTSLVSSHADLLTAVVAASDAALETSRETADSAVRSVLVNTYRLDESGFGRLAAQEVMLFVEKNLRRNRLTEANRLLELADTSKLSSRSLIGLIRSTARLKDRLPAWRVAYLKSREAVTKQSKNPEALFVGLPKLQEADAPKATR